MQNIETRPEIQRHFKRRNSTMIVAGLIIAICMGLSACASVEQ
jgi:hypothetical protein